MKIMTNCIQAFLPPILKTGTLVDKTDDRLNKGEGSSVLANFKNLSITEGVAPEG